jgi:hypothetical protein
MPSLGSFGAALREFDPDSERDTFDFFGETFVVEGIIPPMLNLQLGAALSGKIAEIDGNAAMYEAMRCALTKPERTDGDEVTAADEQPFDRFYRLAVDKRCDLEQLVQLVFTLVGAQAGRPTEQLPTSAPGQLPTSTSSNSPASDSLDSPVLRSVDEVLAG